MYLCFVDESGSPPRLEKAAARRFFVIAGLMMRDADWHGLARELHVLRERFAVAGEIKWRFFGPDNTDADNSVAHLDQACRDRFRQDIFRLITNRTNVKLVACAVDAVAAYKLGRVQSPEDIYHHAYRSVSEKFQYHLQDRSREMEEKQLGIIIADPRGKKQDEGLRMQHRQLLEETSGLISRYDNLVETIFLTPSHHSVGIQLADMAAGAIGRALNYRDTQFLKFVMPAFRKSASGRINGWGFVKFPI